MKLINIGYGNTVNSDRVVAAVSANAFQTFSGHK